MISPAVMEEPLAGEASEFSLPIAAVAEASTEGAVVKAAVGAVVGAAVGAAVGCAVIALAAQLRPFALF